MSKHAPIYHAIAIGCPMQYLRMECGMPAKGAADHHQIAANRAATTCPACKRVTDGEPKPWYDAAAKPEHVAWANGLDSGISSKTLLSANTGIDYAKGREHHPLDPDDFGRCYRLLQLFPELRSQMDKVAAKSGAWARLVGAWGELEALCDEEFPTGTAPKMYARMQELING